MKVLRLNQKAEFLLLRHSTTALPVCLTLVKMLFKCIIYTVSGDGMMANVELARMRKEEVVTFLRY
jgi:hypothetical protein